MKFSIKNIYLILILLTLVLPVSKTFGKDTDFKYSKDDISNYFSGVVSLSRNDNLNSYNYLKKIKSISKIHTKYDLQFIRSLILLEKFEKAFSFSKKVWSKDDPIFEIDLLLGLQSYINKDYKNSKKYFSRLNEISESNLFFEDFFGNILMSWTEASENNQKASFEFLDKIPDRYIKLKKIQNSFLNCYFDTSKTELAFRDILDNKNNSFSRYNYFLVNYLISKKKNTKAKIYINKKASSYNSSLLIKQTASYINKKKIKR